MSNDSDPSSEETVEWRKRLRLKRAILQRLEEEAKATVRTPEGMAAYIIEEYFRQGGRMVQNV